MMMFRRRIYTNIFLFAKDIGAIWLSLGALPRLLYGKKVSPAFRERLMLVVTGVNQCRYCAYAHAKAALSSGISRQEIAALGDSMFEGSPKDQVPALLYAQHYAETYGKPDIAVRENTRAQYDPQTFSAIELSIKMIRMFNLFGNTFDFILFKISFGKWGHS